MCQSKCVASISFLFLERSQKEVLLWVPEYNYVDGIAINCYGMFFPPFFTLCLSIHKRHALHTYRHWKKNWKDIRWELRVCAWLWCMCDKSANGSFRAEIDWMLCLQKPFQEKSFLKFETFSSRKVFTPSQPPMHIAMILFLFSSPWTAAAAARMCVWNVCRPLSEFLSSLISSKPPHVVVCDVNWIVSLFYICDNSCTLFTGTLTIWKNVCTRAAPNWVVIMFEMLVNHIEGKHRLAGIFFSLSYIVKEFAHMATTCW